MYFVHLKIILDIHIGSPPLSLRPLKVGITFNKLFINNSAFHMSHKFITN